MRCIKMDTGGGTISPEGTAGYSSSTGKTYSFTIQSTHQSAIVTVAFGISVVCVYYIPDLSKSAVTKLAGATGADFTIAYVPSTKAFSVTEITGGTFANGYFTHTIAHWG